MSDYRDKTGTGLPPYILVARCPVKFCRVNGTRRSSWVGHRLVMRSVVNFAREEKFVIFYYRRRILAVDVVRTLDNVRIEFNGPFGFVPSPPVAIQCGDIVWPVL